MGLQVARPLISEALHHLIRLFNSGVVTGTLLVLHRSPHTDFSYASLVQMQVKQ